jgi:hypothetical protein
MVAEEDSGGSNALALGDLDDGLRSHHGTASAPQRAVGDNVNALLVAQVDNLLLGKTGVVLNLVDGGNNGSVGEKLLEILDAVLHPETQRVSENHNKEVADSSYVADTNALGLASGNKLLHLLPGVDVVVVMDNVSRAIGLGGELVVVTLGVEKNRPVLQAYD